MALVPHLRVIGGFQAGMVFPLAGAHLTLGREPDVGIALTDPLISRRHAALSRRGDDFWIEDLGSTNGTTVNGELIRGPRLLRGGDEICLGVTRLIFEPPPQTEDTAPKTQPVPHLPPVRLELPLGAEAPARTAAAGPGPVSPGPAGLTETLARRQLMALLRWSEQLRELATAERLADALCAMALEVTEAQRAVALLWRPEETVNLVPMAARHRADAFDPNLPLSQELVRRAIASRSAVLSLDPSDGLARGEEARRRLGSVLCAPLFHQMRLWGALVLDTLPGQPPLTEEEQVLVINLCHQSAAALAALEARERAVERLQQSRELAVARELQENLLPKRLPDLPADWAWSAISHAARTVGGDYYDAWPLGEGRWGVALGDVSGKGVPAALLLSSMRAYLRAEASRPGATPAEALAQLNRWACLEAPRHMFMSLCFGVLDAGAQEFTYTNAGHPPPLWITADREVRTLECGGMVLGVESGQTYAQETLKIRPGDTLLFFTDGVTDTQNSRGEVFGQEGVRELATLFCDAGPEVLCQRLWEATHAFLAGAEVRDDFTVLAIRVGQRRGG